jgi:cold shock CspA family protein
MAEGTVLWFDAERGVGRTRCRTYCGHTQLDGGGHQILRQEDYPSFTVRHSESGPRAVGIYII